MEQLECKLTEYVISYAARIMWGMDCDLEELLLEIYKLQNYVFIKESLLTTNDCTSVIPVNQIQKIDSYINSISRKKNKTCRNCS